MWELITTEDTEWIQDFTGNYTFITHVKDDIVRLDWMGKDDMPIISFQGYAENVRKYVVRHAEREWPLFSAEHASYIGRELARAELLKEKYIQD